MQNVSEAVVSAEASQSELPFVPALPCYDGDHNAKINFLLRRVSVKMALNATSVCTVHENVHLAAMHLKLVN